MRRLDRWKELMFLLPKAPDWRIDWERLRAVGFDGFFKQMAEVEQNPSWHGEGDVWSHTQMVCQELVKISAYQKLPPLQRQEVFLAALLHDIGKMVCTRLEEGQWISPSHTTVGARMAREYLRVEFGLGGTLETLKIRETICNLIRYHSVPTHILDQTEPERRLMKIASNGELTPDFTIELLCILEEADVRGRIYKGMEESIETVLLCAQLAEEIGCYKGAFSFPSSYAAHAYLSGRNIVPGQALYDDTWGEVILLSGLPGTGKDTWLREYNIHLPVISLDEIRKEMGVLPTEHQGVVVAKARETAKEYLRKKQPFVWNATNITASLREKQVRLFHEYHASVRIVYLETGWEEELRRNKERKEAVPEQVIGKMQKSLTLPERFEAENIQWECV